MTGPAELLEGGRNGVLVPAGDSAALAQLYDRHSGSMLAQVLENAEVELEEGAGPSEQEVRGIFGGQARKG